MGCMHVRIVGCLAPVPRFHPAIVEDFHVRDDFSARDDQILKKLLVVGPLLIIKRPLKYCSTAFSHVSSTPNACDGSYFPTRCSHPHLFPRSGHDLPPPCSPIRTRPSVWSTPPSPSKTGSARATAGPTTVAAGAGAVGGSADGSGRTPGDSLRPARGGRPERTGETRSRRVCRHFFLR